MTGPSLAYAAPTPAEYCALRLAAGLSAMDQVAAVAGLPASWCAVSLRDGEELVGMGRMVGDGALFLQVVDVAVRPDWQRRGLGRRIMAALMDDARRRAPGGVIVTLLADGEATKLYEQFGFRLSAPHSQGMLLRL
ncbi:GNAT family N-acetyltransferase [Frateuria sp. GZRR35]|uniref:GNAT family N-acetyltransferase n=1 Tax=unclassified Frateuria TaxID=2648894 RepID=UPI003EDBF768